MPNVEIIAIGTELLLGEIPDSNTAIIARRMRTIGLDLFRTIIVGDNEERISEEIRSSLNRADVVITTGGLGPTIDDPTRNAVAKAFNTQTEFHEYLWQDIKQRFKEYGKTPTLNNRRQAYLPKGAVAIRNPVGTAPAFYLRKGEKWVFSLPGVPSEMITLMDQYVIPTIIQEFNLHNVIHSRIIHTAGMGESAIDELISQFEKSSNPTVGLAAHPGQVDIRITAKAEDLDEAYGLIQPVENQITSLLGSYIFGFDHMSLHQVVKDLMVTNNSEIEIHFQTDFFESMPHFNHLDKIAEVVYDNHLSNKPAIDIPSVLIKNKKKLLTIFISLDRDDQTIFISFNYVKNKFTKKLKFGGHPSLFHEWLENQLLNEIRLLLQKIKVQNE